MFKIGEFAKLTKVSIRMLRYYDETGLLKPAATDQFTGYRLYSTEQISRLQKILLLRDMDFHVAEIADVLNHWDSETVTGFLTAKKNEILAAMELKKQRVKKIDMAMADIQSDKIEIHYNVTIKEIPTYQIVSYREMIPNYFCEGALWEKLYAFVEREQIELLPGSNNIAFYHNEERLEDRVDVEVAAIVKRVGRNQGSFVYRETKAVKTMACVMVYGPYENIGPAYHSFAYWLAQHKQYEMAGPSRQICHIGAYNEENPQNFLTEVQTPVRIKA